MLAKQDISLWTIHHHYVWLCRYRTLRVWQMDSRLLWRDKGDNKSAANGAEEPELDGNSWKAISLTDVSRLIPYLRTVPARRYLLNLAWERISTCSQKLTETRLVRIEQLPSGKRPFLQVKIQVEPFQRSSREVQSIVFHRVSSPSSFSGGMS